MKKTFLFIAVLCTFLGNSQKIADTTFVNIKDLDSTIVLDMKYASSDNFLKQNVYGCEVCYLRYKTAKKLIEANQDFKEKGLKIKIFDCYRPLDIQKKMWELVPNPDYVANPVRGSIHNRGCAIDITLVDENNKELDFGTAFDHFGPESSHNYENLPEQVLENRKMLRKIMKKNGFRAFESEWWHYNLKHGIDENLANFKWKCD